MFMEDRTLYFLERVNVLCKINFYEIILYFNENKTLELLT